MAEFLEQAVNFVEEKVAVITMTPVNSTEETVAILVKKPEATLNDVIVKILLAKVSVSNPYSTTIPIDEVNYILKSADSVMASGKIPDPGLLMPMNSTLRDVSTEWAIDYDLQLCFTFDIPVIGDITIPIKGNGEIKLPTISEFLHGGKKKDKDRFSIKNWIQRIVS
ncbi:hypothetical protein MKX01_031482 [Papaver californicum]|nr:hypothetical protein MKX01_031482 [Papaver californicum]